MATYAPDWAPIDNHPRFQKVPRMGYAAKLAAHTADLDKVRCPDTTKKGEPCRGNATETGYCAGHSRARRLL